jgi:hypothetical protein
LRLSQSGSSAYHSKSCPDFAKQSSASTTSRCFLNENIATTRSLLQAWIPEITISKDESKHGQIEQSDDRLNLYVSPQALSKLNKERESDEIFCPWESTALSKKFGPETLTTLRNRHVFI